MNISGGFSCYRNCGAALLAVVKHKNLVSDKLIRVKFPPSEDYRPDVLTELGVRDVK